eukprot:gene9131-1153_t
MYIAVYGSPHAPALSKGRRMRRRSLRGAACAGAVYGAPHAPALSTGRRMRRRWLRGAACAGAVYGAPHAPALSVGRRMRRRCLRGAACAGAVYGAPHAPALWRVAAAEAAERRRGDRHPPFGVVGRAAAACSPGLRRSAAIPYWGDAEHYA